MKLFKILILAIAAVFFTSTVSFADEKDQLLSTLVEMPVFWHQDRGETIEARTERLAPLSGAIHNAAKRYRPEGVSVRTMEAALATLAFKETALAKNVGDGRCEEMPKGMRCDMDKHGKPRAKTYFQLWKDACPAVHDKSLVPGSEEELNVAAECAAKLMTSAYARCDGKNKDGIWAGAFAGYRSQDCSWVLAVHRSDYMKKVQSKLEQK